MTTPTHYVSVIGASQCSAEVPQPWVRSSASSSPGAAAWSCAAAWRVSWRPWRAACGRAGGTCIGILPTLDRRGAAPDLTYALCTGLGHARNLAVVASGDVVIALGGAWGTLSEMVGLARSVGRQVIALHTWNIEPDEGVLDGVQRANTPAEAVELALVTLRS